MLRLPYMPLQYVINYWRFCSQSKAVCTCFCYNEYTGAVSLPELRARRTNPRLTSISVGNIIYHTPFQVELALNVGIEIDLSGGFDVVSSEGFYARTIAQITLEESACNRSIVNINVHRICTWTLLIHLTFSHLNSKVLRCYINYKFNMDDANWAIYVPYSLNVGQPHSVSN